MRQRLSQLVVVACALACASLAGAHAFLDHAIPAVGSTVHGSPPQVKLWFTQRLEPAFTSAQVTDRDGKRVSPGDASLDPSDRTLLVVPVSQLPPGSYRVKWRVVSVDTHVTEG